MNFRKFFILMGLCLALTACGQSETETGDSEQPVTLETSTEKSSYALGMDIGNNISQGEMNIDVDVLLKGLRDGLENNDPLMSEDEQMEALTALQQEFMEAQAQKTQEQAEQNIEEGSAYMDEFREKEDVEETESGILYRVINRGEGEKPGPEDVVTVHYQGTTVDGTVFDSSIERGEPATFPLNQVIPGWTEILQLMPQGSKWEVVIPPDQAYGDQQAGPEIGPNSTLIFEIELMEVKDPQ
ncbi:MAG: FKBP-type peptidyl-prolyl cis-trans isomerase [Desulfonatronovibrio sp.]